MAIAYGPPPTLSRAGSGVRARIIQNRPRLLNRGERIRRSLTIAFVALLTLGGGTVLFGAIKIRSIAQHLPPVKDLADTRSHPLTTIVSSDGVLLASFETHYRRPVTIDKISPFLIDATLATEDARFYNHTGVDYRGVARAVVSNLSAGNWTGQGGSTITQQLARNLYLSNQKTMRRKIEEMMLANEIERRFKKPEILEAYFNTIYYGNGCYGAEAASLAYFHKPARDLELGEAALLAGLPQRPAVYSPIQHLPEALQRRTEVLKRMAATGKISAEESARIAATSVRVYRPHLKSQADWRAPYFVTHVLAAIRDHYGPEYVYNGVQIVTTLNWQIQKAAERSLRDGLARGSGPNTGAIVAIDPRSGAIRALVGGADFQRDQFDAATQGIRQPGSAFKPIVYAAAFDTNVCNLVNTIDDKKLIYNQAPRDWVVHNYDGRYRGPVSVLEAIRQSINTVAVQVAEQTGPTTIQSYAQELGISTPMSPDLPLALGASGVHPIDLCSAFSAFANGGVRYSPYSVQQIRDGLQNETYRDELAARLHPAFMNPDTVNQINLALREVVLNGTGAAASGVPDAHGKTGTTSSHRDAWFVGYTGSLATVVWMGHVDKYRSKTGEVATRYLPMPGAAGGRVCAPVWARFMKAAAPIQRRVDLARKLGDSVVPQLAREPLLNQLREAVMDTDMGKSAAADLAQNAVVPSTGNTRTQVEVGNSEDETAGIPAETAAASEGEPSTRDDRELQQDMEAGYREFERRGY